MKKVLLSAFIAVGMQLMAGIYSVYETTDLTTKSAPTRIETYIQGEKVKVIPTSPGDKNSMRIILNLGSNKMMMVDDKKKEVMELDLEQIKAMLDSVKPQLDAAMKEMEKSLSQLPPEQRAQIEKMMKSRMPQNGGAEAEAKWDVKKTGKNEKISGFSCALYEVFRNNAKQSDVWSADAKDLKITEKDLQGFQALAEHFKKLSETLSKYLPKQGLSKMTGAMNAMSEIKGVPIKTVGYENGKATSETIFKEMTSKEFSASEFEVPADYKRTNPMEGMNHMNKK